MKTRQGELSDTSTQNTDGEINRFVSILRRHATAQGTNRDVLRGVLVQYLKFSPNQRRLINELIETCTAMKHVERLDIAVDVLSQLGVAIQEYALEYLHNDMQQFGKLYPKKKFQPNDDYWYVLLRSVGKCQGEKRRSLAIISACQDEQTRGVSEAVVEALGDLSFPESLAVLRNISETHTDKFVRDLASEVVSGCQ